MIQIITKLKEKGIAGAFKALKCRFCFLINKSAYFFFRLSKIDDMGIVLESEGDLCDNTYALFDYMRKNQYLDKYKVTWLVDHVEDYKDERNVNYVSRENYKRINLKLMKVLNKCRWYIYTHNNLFDYIGVRQKKDQRLTFLSHGVGYKIAKGTFFDASFSEMIVTGEIPAINMSNFVRCDISKVVQLGYPRLDYFFEDDTETNKKVLDFLNASQYLKIIIWMPTFRQSEGKLISEDYITNETGLPFFGTEESLENFDLYLKEKNVLLIFKIHHLQSNLAIFKKLFHNIRIIKDDELNKNGIQLYQMIAHTDALITDYSAISVDYLLLNRPCIYTLDDYEEYNKSRGILPDTINYMAGYHVYNIDEMKEALTQIIAGKDIYIQERNNILNKMHKYQDGNSSKRILDYLNILQ